MAEQKKHRYDLEIPEEGLSYDLHGQSEAQWLERRQELVRLAEDDFSIVGFYQSCQVSGVK